MKKSLIRSLVLTLGVAVLAGPALADGHEHTGKHHKWSKEHYQERYDNATDAEKAMMDEKRAKMEEKGAKRKAKWKKHKKMKHSKMSHTGRMNSNVEAVEELEDDFYMYDESVNDRRDYFRRIAESRKARIK